jgi:methanogenic corrinoid protein MtbC1
MAAPGEQHALGLGMVADHFRRDGWEVCMATCPTKADGSAGEDPLRRVHDEWFDVIGMSVGSARNVAAARDQISALRRRSRNRAVGVLIGGAQAQSDPGLREAVGADAVAGGAAGAPAAAEALLASRFARADAGQAATGSAKSPGVQAAAAG